MRLTWARGRLVKCCSFTSDGFYGASQHQNFAEIRVFSYEVGAVMNAWLRKCRQAQNGLATSSVHSTCEEGT